jgi:hypothetical protein
MNRRGMNKGRMDSREIVMGWRDRRGGITVLRDSRGI